MGANSGCGWIWSVSTHRKRTHRLSTGEFPHIHKMRWMCGRIFEHRTDCGKWAGGREQSGLCGARPPGRANSPTVCNSLRNDPPRGSGLTVHSSIRGRGKHYPHSYRLLIFAVISLMISAFSGSFFIISSIRLIELITVVWSRPSNSLPISFKDRLVMRRI